MLPNELYSSRLLRICRSRDAFPDASTCGNENTTRVDDALRGTRESSQLPDEAYRWWSRG